MEEGNRASPLGRPIFIIRARNQGGFEIFVEPPEYGDVRPTQDFATEADAQAWVRANAHLLDPYADR